MSKEINLNNENFEEILSQGVHLVELSGDQCSGCVALNPIVHKLLQKYEGINYHYVIVTHNSSDICHKYNIDRIPALLFLHNGELLSLVKGFQPEEVLDLWLEDEMLKVQGK